MVERTPDDQAKKPAEETKKVELMSQTKQIPTDSQKLVQEDLEHDLVGSDEDDEETKDPAKLEKQKQIRTRMAD